MTEDEWVVVETYLNSTEAAIGRSVLAGAGIESFIADDYLSGVAPHYSFGTGVRLMVRSSRLEEARAALQGSSDEAASGPPGEDPDAGGDPPVEGDPGPPRQVPPGRGSGRWYAVGGLLVVAVIALAAYGNYRNSWSYEPGGHPACKTAWKERRWDDALGACRELAERNPRWPAGWAYLSMTYTALGRHDEAIAAAKRLTEEDEFGWCYLARALKRADRAAEAREARKAFNDLFPEYECNLGASSGRHPVICPEGWCVE